MLVLGLHGSPRTKSNTLFLLETFLAECSRAGTQTAMVAIPQLDLKACIGCGFCEKKGVCVIDDDAMAAEIYALLRKADIVVVATPIYFYNATSQMKALIDRSQAFWSRKYVFKLSDPKHRLRGGFLLSVGATKGANLFDGLKLTARYFFDAINADFKGSLTYRRMEKRNALAQHPTVVKDVELAVSELLTPYLKRRLVLFVGRDDARRSQMAAALSNYLAGDRIEAVHAGIQPTDVIDPVMVAIMQGENIDMAYRQPQSIDQALAGRTPQIVVTLDKGIAEIDISANRRIALKPLKNGDYR